MSLAEQIIGVKAKQFLMATIYLMSAKYSRIVTNWADHVTEVITTTISDSLDISDERKVEENVAKFLQWLGFSPVDVKWQPEQKVGRFMIGTSRMWEKDPKVDDVTRVLMLSVIGAIGQKLMGERPEVIQLSGQLPPRINVGYEIRERYGDVTSGAQKAQGAEVSGAKKAESPSISATAHDAGSPTRYRQLIEPFLGPEVDKDLVSKIFVEEVVAIARKVYEKELEAFDVSSLNILLFLFQRAAKEDKWRDRAVELGKSFGAKVKEKYSKMKPNGAIEGMGNLKPDEFEEMLFYGKHQSSGGEEFCHFLSLIFQEYIGLFMNKTFKAEKPLCATSGSSMCLYAFVR